LAAPLPREAFRLASDGYLTASTPVGAPSVMFPINLLFLVRAPDARPVFDENQWAIKAQPFSTTLATSL